MKGKEFGDEGLISKVLYWQCSKVWENVKGSNAVLC